MPARTDFDRDFYERFYRRSGTAVVGADEMDRLGRFVLAYLAHLRIGVGHVLDAGCGVGLWRDTLQRLDVDAEYTGFEVSEYLCEEYGWHNASVDTFRSRRKFDLVICQDVLQYVDTRTVEAGIANLAGMCRGAFYLDVPTKEDFASGALDLRRTDRDINLRGARWYRRRMMPHFISVGGGLFLPRDTDAPLLALERG